MDVRSRTRRNLTPVVGGMTAVATAAGVVAPVAQLAPAGAQTDSASPALAAAGLAGAGAFESCSAYFGYGKDAGFIGIVDFDVADVNGDDATAHDVDDDTQVLLVMENEESDTLECVAAEVTEEEWADEHGGDPAAPAWPGPGHFTYPSVNLAPVIDGFGQVVTVGFRVSEIPDEHTLVSPEGVQPLDDMFLDPDEVAFSEIIDPEVLAFLTGEVGATAADAYEAALIECDGAEEINPTDADLLAAANALVDIFSPDDEITDIDCFEVDILQAISSYYLSLLRSVAYVEDIRLSVPEAPSPVEPPAALPAAAAPTFTG